MRTGPNDEGDLDGELAWLRPCAADATAGVHSHPSASGSGVNPSTLLPRESEGISSSSILPGNIWKIPLTGRSELRYPAQKVKLRLLLHKQPPQTLS